VSTTQGDLHQLRREVGIVFQSYNLFAHLTWKKTSCWRCAT